MAFTILALSLGVAVQAFSTGLRSEALAQDYTWATLLAESQLAAMGASHPLREGEQTGKLDGRFNWRATIEPVSDAHGEATDDAPLSLYQVTIEVFWTELFRQRSVSLTTWRLAPKE